MMRMAKWFTKFMSSCFLVAAFKIANVADTGMLSLGLLGSWAAFVGCIVIAEALYEGVT